jgi:DNA-binding transcriptional ArsR family regulator
MTREPQGTAPPFVIGAKMAKALANPWRNRILSELHLRPMSPSEFADETGGDLGNISRYFRQLRVWGYLEVVEERRGGSRRGAVERVYRAIQRVHFDTAAWEKIPLHLREECSGAIIEAYILRVVQAIEAGTFPGKRSRSTGRLGRNSRSGSMRSSSPFSISRRKRPRVWPSPARSRSRRPSASPPSALPSPPKSRRSHAGSCSRRAGQALPPRG